MTKNRLEEFAMDAALVFLAHPDWTYGIEKRQPSISDLENMLRHLETVAWDDYDENDNEPTIIRSGRLSVIITNYENDGGPEIIYSLELGTEHYSKESYV